jgi:hypothetical protein
VRDVPEQALAFGFANEPVGSHTSRTIMLAELRSLLAACPLDAGLETYRAAVVGDNALGKGTVATRRASFRQLRELYALDPCVLLFSSLRALWDADAAAQPLLAVLCASARDPLLRVAAGWITDVTPGLEVSTEQLAQVVERAYPGRYKSTVLAVTARNLIGSLRQSGHVADAPGRARTPATNRPTATAYALILGHLCGARGDLLFDTPWARLLDQPAYAVREHAAAAGRQGWLEYRHAGGVTEISFRQLLHGKGPNQ